MTTDKIQEYVVIVNDGSGCIFQPKTNDYTYVLTVKHIFEDFNREQLNTNITITRFQFENDDWKEIYSIYPLLEGENYFPHSTKDLAIIKIPKIDRLVDLVRVDEIDQDKQGFTFAGYPRSRRKYDISNSFRVDDISIKNKRKRGLREAKVEGNPGIRELRGMGGGAILKIYDEFILLAGIQNQMADVEEFGVIEFYPMINFDEIVEAYKDKLLPLPIYTPTKREFMTPDKIKEYFVIVNGGSGCIVQPPDDEIHTYILTAKHNIKDPEKPGEPENFTDLTRFKFENDTWIPIPILFGYENYFPHVFRDIAILRIPKIDNLNKTVLINIDEDRDGYSLFGYPNSRKEENIKALWYRTDHNIKILETKKNQLIELALDKPYTYNEIVGQSGGAIGKTSDGLLFIAGVLIKMVAKKDDFELLGRLEFCPASYFNEIIEAHMDKLRSILPIYSK